MLDSSTCFQRILRFMGCDRSMSALGLADQDAATLPFVAESYYQAHKETSLQLQARAAVTSNTEVRELILSAATQVTQAIAKRESDLVTPMARAAAYINPKYMYGEQGFECPRSAEVVQDWGCSRLS